MPLSFKELRIIVSGDKILISRTVGPPRDGAWGKNYIKLEIGSARIFHKVLNKFRLTYTFEKNDYEILGKTLFKILLNDSEARKFFISQVRDIKQDKNIHCRVYLEFRDAPIELVTLPWEYILIEEEGELLPFYLGADNKLQFDLIRTIGNGDDNRPNFKVEDNKELNVIAIISDPQRKPEGRTPLDSAAYWQMFADLRKQFSSIHTFELGNDGKPRKATFVEDLVNTIRQLSQPYVIHFYGHAQVKGQKAQLCFLDDNDQMDWISDDEFAEFFSSDNDFPLPAMVILQACESGQVVMDNNGDLSGIAYTLAKEKILAVVGMQNIVTEDVSMKFVTRMYESLLKGEDVAMAVTKGRQHLGCCSANPKEYYSDNTFGTPVLYISTLEPISLLPAKTISNEEEANWPTKSCDTCKRSQQVSPERVRCNIDGCRGNLVLIDRRQGSGLAADSVSTIRDPSRDMAVPVEPKNSGNPR